MSVTMIHVGLDKTGTTSIQYALDSLRDQLGAANILYPISPEFQYHHLDFARAFGFSWGFSYPDNAIDSRALDYVSQFPAHAHSLLLSSEHFSFYGNTDSIAALKAWIDHFRAASEIMIVISLRNQVEWFLSVYAECIKWGDKRDIATFYEGLKYRVDFAKFVDEWALVFGRDRIRIVDYDATRNDSVDQILRLVGASDAIRQAAHALTIPFENRTIPHALLDIIRTTDFAHTGPDFYSFVINRIYQDDYFKSFDLPADWTWAHPPAFIDDLAFHQDGNATICADFNLTDSRLVALPAILQAATLRHCDIPAATVERVRARLLADEAQYFLNT